jgi:hypothetical protein
MLKRTNSLITAAVLIVTAAFILNGCSRSPNTNSDDQPQPKGTPSRSLTTADLAKLKWLEGTWKGMDGDKPFFERYRFEGDSKMIVEGFANETLAAVSDTSVFELRDGEFGHTDEHGNRSAASSITADAVQFVPAGGSGNFYRFEQQPGGTWRAVLEWPAESGKLARQKIYLMERYKAP